MKMAKLQVEGDNLINECNCIPRLCIDTQEI